MLLDMTHNMIGNLGASAFGDGLAVNTHLAILSVQGNKITDDGIIGLKASIAEGFLKRRFMK